MNGSGRLTTRQFLWMVEGLGGGRPFFLLTVMGLHLRLKIVFY